MYGGKISATDLNILLDASYEKALESKDDYEIDKELSNEVSRVFRKKGTDEVFVVHTGSKDMRDVLENYGYITRGY